MKGLPVAGRVQAKRRSDWSAGMPRKYSRVVRAGDGEGGELVLGEELAGSFDAVLALGGGDGDGFVGAVFEGLDGGRFLRGGRLLRGGREWGLGVEKGNGGGRGGGGEEESAAREHGEIVG